MLKKQFKTTKYYSKNSWLHVPFAQAINFSRLILLDWELK